MVTGGEVVGADNTLEEGEGAVSELHGDALEGLLGLGDIDEVEDDGLVVAEHVAVGDPEEEGVADLSCGSSDGHPHGFLGLCEGGEGAPGQCSHRYFN